MQAGRPALAPLSDHDAGMWDSLRKCGPVSTDNVASSLCSRAQIPEVVCGFDLSLLVPSLLCELAALPGPLLGTRQCHCCRSRPLFIFLFNLEKFPLSQLLCWVGREREG